jgi:hypothetical protein
MLALAALILCWKVDRRLRLLCAGAFALAVAGDVFTFGYFYPRNAIMFGGPIATLDAIRQAHAEWSAMNWLRSGMVAVNLAFSLSGLLALTKVQTLRSGAGTTSGAGLRKMATESAF